MIPQRLSVVTLGVADVAKARAFYERLGFKPAGFENESVVFFDMNGAVLALFGRVPLAEDATVPHEGGGFRGVACAINVESEAAVDAALKHAANCGAHIARAASKVFWGGYSGYFADPDGHLWEVAFNPFFPLDEYGHVLLPQPQSGDNA